jgi:hypothetical protein
MEASLAEIRIAKKEKLDILEDLIERNKWDDFCDELEAFLKKYAVNDTIMPVTANEYGSAKSNTEYRVRKVTITKSGLLAAVVIGREGFGYENDVDSFDLRKTLPKMSSSRTPQISISGNSYKFHMVTKDVISNMIFGIRKSLNLI